jgi:hypothetical protein
MEKKLRLKIAGEFGRAMERVFPMFEPTVIKSIFVSTSKSLWRCDSETSSYFILLAPEPKNQQDSITVELGWSKLRRFPEVIQIPSVAFPVDVPGSYVLDEGVVRIHTLFDNEFGWVDVTDENVSEVVRFFIEKLEQKGIPFLQRFGLQL